MSVPIGRVAPSSTDLRAADAPTVAKLPDNLEGIRRKMQSFSEDSDGLIRAVQLAREQGFSWARIGVVLGVSRQAAQQRFGRIDPTPEEPAEPGDEQPVDVELAAAVATLQQRTVDMSAMAELSNDEVVALADQVAVPTKLQDPYLRALREAIVVTLYKRGMSQPQIATVIGKSPQRVSQIIVRHYDRQRRDWEAERSQWQKGT